MTIALVVTAGFGNATFNGTITDVVLRGYGIGEVTDTADDFLSVYGFIDAAGENVRGDIIGGADTYARAGYWIDRYATDGLSGGQLEVSVFGEITDTHTVYGQIDAAGENVSGPIDDSGLNVEGEI